MAPVLTDEDNLGRLSGPVPCVQSLAPDCMVFVVPIVPDGEGGAGVMVRMDRSEIETVEED